MADLEAMARPILMPMITGHAAALSIEEQILVATWMAMKSMVAEVAP